MKNLKYLFSLSGLASTLILCSLVACTARKNLVGTYYSNFAVHGFFGTKVTLKQDSGFEFRMRGDLVFDTSYGYFRTVNDYVILYHLPFQLDTAGKSIEEQRSIALSYAMSTNRHLNKPGKYLVSRNKLFVCDENGDVIRKQFGYSKIPQFIFFGKHWYKRRYYLKKNS